MRIIAGSAKGSQIFAPRGQDTRPTQDRVRESLFNILQWDIHDAVVLDLFAGSGALSLEALSRGARWAVVVDSDREAIGCIERNLARLNLAKQAQVMKCEWQAAVARLAEQGITFDLVFLDPPYRMEDTAGMMESLAAAKLLTAKAILVVEHRRGAFPAEHPCFSLKSRRGYGDTEISFLTYAGA